MAADRCFDDGGRLAHLYGDIKLRDGAERRRRRRRCCSSSTHKSYRSNCSANSISAFYDKSSGAADNDAAEQCSGASNAGFTRRCVA